jgi:hypothetical protein
LADFPEFVFDVINVDVIEIILKKKKKTVNCVFVFFNQQKGLEVLLFCFQKNCTIRSVQRKSKYTTTTITTKKNMIFFLKHSHIY